MKAGHGPQRSAAPCLAPEECLRECQESAQEGSHFLYPSNLDPGAIICLTHRKREQPESISGQNCLARGEMIEADPSIANPNRTLQQAAGVGSA